MDRLADNTQLSKQANAHFEQALMCFDRVLKLDPMNIDAWMSLCLCYFAQAKRIVSVTNTNTIVRTQEALQTLTRAETILFQLASKTNTSSFPPFSFPSRLFAPANAVKIANTNRN